MRCEYRISFAQFISTALSQTKTCGTVSLTSGRFSSGTEYVQGIITSVKFLDGSNKQVDHYFTAPPK